MLNFTMFCPSRFRLKRFGLIAFLILTRIVTTASEAQAVNIPLHQAPQYPPPRTVYSGSHLEPGDNGTLGDIADPLPNPAVLQIQPPGTSVSGYAGQVSFQDFENTIGAAAACWEQALPGNNDAIDLNIGVAPFKDNMGNNINIFVPNRINGVATSVDGTLAVQTGNTIIFNSNAKFFVSSTPDNPGNSPSYFSPLSTDSVSLVKTNSSTGTVNVNVLRGYFSDLSSQFPFNGFDGAYDLFTVALHEIGHALGVTPSNLTIGSLLNTKGNLVLNEPYPMGYGTTQIPTTDYPNDIHLNLLSTLQYADHIRFSSITINKNLPGVVMYPTLLSGQRKELTDADILAVAAAGKYQNVNLSACPFNPIYTIFLPPNTSIPEPSPLPALLLGGGVVLVSRRRWNSKDDSF